MPLTVGVVCHDAGGANMVSHYLRETALGAVYCLDGPAVHIFQEVLGAVESEDLATVLGECDWLLCGSSWASNLELLAIEGARILGKKSICFLDHWVNFRERFTLNSLLMLPDEMWVADSRAAEIAAECFPTLIVREKENFYLKYIKSCLLQNSDNGREVTSSQTGDPHARLLYVCEPILEHAREVDGGLERWGYSEFDALDFFFANATWMFPELHSIIIRPHPSESSAKYLSYQSESSPTVTISVNKSLVQDLAEVETVVGASSMALVAATVARKSVFSSIPPGGAPHGLPSESIVYLRDLER